jgi:hypothetical protein
MERARSSLHGKATGVVLVVRLQTASSTSMAKDNVFSVAIGDETWLGGAQSKRRQGAYASGEQYW